jgi:hypothetical protein
MKGDSDLRMEIFTRIEVGGLKVRAQRVDEDLVDLALMFKKEVPVVLFYGPIGPRRWWAAGTFALVKLN